MSKEPTPITQAISRFEQTVAPFEAQNRQLTELLGKSFEALTTIGRTNLEAILSANRLALTSLDTVWQELDSFSRAAFDKNQAAGTALLEARTIEEVIAVQTGYLKESLDSLLAESTKLSDLAIKVANQAITPAAEAVAGAASSPSPQAVRRVAA